MIEVRTTVVDEDQVDTVLTEDMDFRGSIRTTGSLMIRGRLEGSIHSTSDLYIEDAAWIRGSIRAGAVVVKGTVFGPIVASLAIELLPGSSVEGDLDAPSITLEEGSFHRGARRETEGGECREDP